ncbi:PepSY domain-containing protein [Saccharothrix sp. MB29]|nr:PepSY domain-containing protein [Saccharothrix sp. MB29]
MRTSPRCARRSTGPRRPSAPATRGPRRRPHPARHAADRLDRGGARRRRGSTPSSSHRRRWPDVAPEIERGWPTQVDAVAVTGGAVVDEVRFDDYPFMAKLARWGIDAHMGVLFGWPNQLLLLALGLGLVALVVLGYRVWWLRRPTRGFGRPVPRGQWRKVPRAQLVAVLVVAALVGWSVPLFGLSLLAFLLVDAVVGTRRGKTAPETEPQSETV